MLADTHLTASSVGSFVDALRAQLERADVILHAGDITDESLLPELERFAPVHAVAGNNDVGSGLPISIEVDVGGAAVAMIHDSGASTGRATRLARRFPTADVVVFGHSHLPWNDTTEIEGGVQLHVNPGSPTQRRQAPSRTVGWLTIGVGSIEFRHEDV